MKIKIQEALSFEHFSNQVMSYNPPIEVAYKLAKLKRILQGDIDFYNIELEKIIKKYAQKNEDGTYKFSEDGKMIMIDTDKIEECQSQMSKLNQLEIEVDIDAYLLDIEDFKSIKTEEINMYDLIIFFK